MKATVTWDGDSWVGVLDEGGITKSQRLELLVARLPELAQMITGRKVPASEIELEMAVGGPTPGEDGQPSSP